MVLDATIVNIALPSAQADPFGALSAPAALSLLNTTFTEARERARAFGVHGAIAGAGGAVGLLLGGVLTDVLDWRWTLFVTRTPRE
ncbi:hypothetical protein GCM10010254_48950 [Streptomyces chromofuscus]|nr:hypothetical protein GCM10010254_48950 [Streptomyces chromofuscus]